MKIMAANSNLPLARAIAGYLETSLVDAGVRRFADEEIFVEIHENVRGEDVFVVSWSNTLLCGIRAYVEINLLVVFDSTESNFKSL